MITADKALVTQRGADIDLELYRMTVDPVDADNRTMAHVNRFVYTLKDAIKGSKYRKKTKDLDFSDIRERIAEQREWMARQEATGAFSAAQRDDARSDLSKLLVELNKRFVFAMASICFVLVGIPLGIRSQRRESSIGMAISLAVALGYYLLVILMLSCDGRYAARPWLLIWLPVVACGAFAAWLVRKHL